MAQSNDSIQVNTGTGPLVATHLVGGKEYQVVMQADSSGHLIGTNPSYRLIIPNSAVGANKGNCDIFNATGSGKVMRVTHAFAVVDNDTAVTGVVGAEVALTKTTAAGTGGTAAVADSASLTAATIAKHDSANAAIPAQITARAAPTGGATAGAYLGSRWVFTEETNAASALAGLLGAVFVMPNWPIIVRENEGLRFVQGAVASVGTLAFEIHFELV